MSLVVRPCQPSEREAVVALWAQCGLTRPWNDPERDFDLALATATSTVLVGYDGAELAAAVMVGFDGHRGWVYYLAAAPGRRGRGYGRAMMDAAQAWARARGAVKLQLMVRDDNPDAAGFYARLGFAPQSVAVLGKRFD